MIGKVTWQDDDGSHTLILDDDGSVRCDNDMVRESVTRRFTEYRDNYSPADGVFGFGFLTTVAKSLGGKAHIERKPAPQGEDGQPPVY